MATKIIPGCTQLTMACGHYHMVPTLDGSYHEVRVAYQSQKSQKCPECLAVEAMIEANPETDAHIETVNGSWPVVVANGKRVM